ncbi:MAG: outer membrane protein transport protein [Crocinitomicaceae bacterium]|nr:outer membrane protein transport protein [Crocinitomicaceae bacterium]
MLKLTLLFCCISFLGISQGFQVNLQGQVQQGMGSAGTALMQDASGVFFNPGGISFLNKSEITLGVTPTIAKGIFLESKTSERANTVSPLGTPFSAYGVYKAKDSSRLALGLGVYTPFGSTIEWEENWVGRFALTRLQLMSIYFQPTLSYKLSERLGLGAGFVYSYGVINLQKDLPLLDQSGTYGRAELAGIGHGFGFNAGLYFEPTQFLSLGLTYRSQVNMQLKNGTATFTVPSSVEEKFPSGSFTSTLPLPQVLTLGIGVKPNDKWSIAFDVNYVGWKAYDTLAFDYVTNTESLEDTKSPREYENIFAFRLGGQYKINQRLTTRLGIGYAISPIQDGYVTPESPDANRINYTFGLGYTINAHFMVDASFLYTEAYREDTNLETQLSGTFKTRVYAPGVSISYKF